MDRGGLSLCFVQHRTQQNCGFLNAPNKCINGRIVFVLLMGSGWAGGVSARAVAGSVLGRRDHNRGRRQSAALLQLTH